MLPFPRGSNRPPDERVVPGERQDDPRKVNAMAWLVLVVSGLFEAAWATALGRSEGLSKLVPSVVFLVTMVISMLGLGFAMRTLPTGTAYAVWVGIGASTTVIFAMATCAEPFHVVRLLMVLGIVACVVGLKLVS